MPLVKAGREDKEGRDIFHACFPVQPFITYTSASRRGDTVR